MILRSSVKIEIPATGADDGLQLTGRRIVEIVRERIGNRCAANFVQAGENAEYEIVFKIEAGMDTEAYRIEHTNHRQALISAGGSSGLLFGAGKWLHTTQYEQEGFSPSQWQGISKPECEFRGMYFATHFFNFYHVAPIEELITYLEDLTLWGTNHLLLVFPFVNLDGWEDPNTESSIVQLKAIYSEARRLGIKIGIGFASNNQFRNASKHLHAAPNIDPLKRKGNHGVNICTSLPEGRAYILRNIEELCRRFADVYPDFIVQSPYDEGGCGCDKCHPWGANSYLSLAEEIVKTAKAYFPRIKHVLSTWVYDTPYAGEWEALSAKLTASNGWVDYLLADAHENYPEYPLKNEVPGGVPLINFPEISMWGLFPWGGFGANPLPVRLETLWGQIKHIVQGGFPYSEGLYEDINKTIVSSYYWNRQSTAEQTLREYIGYEFSHRVIGQVLKIVSLIEENQTAVHKGQPANGSGAALAWQLAREVDEVLPRSAKTAWRWRILYLRAMLDEERYRIVEDTSEWDPDQAGIWGQVLEKSDAAQSAFRELITIYHAKMEVDESLTDHLWIRPPLARKSDKL